MNVTLTYYSYISYIYRTQYVGLARDIVFQPMHLSMDGCTYRRALAYWSDFDYVIDPPKNDTRRAPQTKPFTTRSDWDYYTATMSESNIDRSSRDMNTSPIPSPQSGEEEDFFASILSLEEQYQAEGHRLGVADGSRAGRIEGRQFGLEKGFSKAVEMGRLRGRASVWFARISPAGSPERVEAGGEPGPVLARMGGSERLRKHVERLAELTDPASLETKNSEEAVQEFEERLGGAKAKATLVGKIAGEEGSVRLQELTPHVLGDGSSADRLQSTRRPVARGEMEDFAGLPHVRTPAQ